jgi:hypothetical protein
MYFGVMGLALVILWTRKLYDKMILILLVWGLIKNFEAKVLNPNLCIIQLLCIF